MEYSMEALAQLRSDSIDETHLMYYVSPAAWGLWGNGTSQGQGKDEWLILGRIVRADSEPVVDPKMQSYTRDKYMVI